MLELCVVAGKVQRGGDEQNWDAGEGSRYLFKFECSPFLGRCLFWAAGIVF